MLSIYFKKNVSILLIGFIPGLFIAFLFKGCDAEPSLNNAAIVPVKEFKKNSEAFELEYLHKIEVLQANNRNLEQEIKITRQHLQAAKSNAKNEEANIKKLIKSRSYPAENLLEKVGSPSLAMKNGSLPCDSLAEEVGRYIEDNCHKDSLYATQSIIQENIIKSKDSIISVHVNKYNELKKIFTSSLVQQEKLITENNHFRKKIKRQKFRKGLFTIGASILTGITADYIIHR